MKLVFLGPPGVGKGTHAKILSESMKVPHLATGDILRQHIREKTKLGMQAKDIIEKGGLVPDELVNAMMFETIRTSGVEKGFILDGYPRTLGQAEAFDKFLLKEKTKLDGVINFIASEDVIVDRLSGRRVCVDCGGNYHIRNIPPKKEGICDLCGKPLTQRKDDQPETIKHRLVTYEKETKPLVVYYSKKGWLYNIAGEEGVTEVQKSIKELFDKIKIRV
ncbi:MAG: adenylate kinase [Candidatus Omnitrophica bacterium]|nr:adenylate kinase [Candidatus Omnitrophota bacterium]